MTEQTTIQQFLTRPGEAYEAQALADFIRIFGASLDIRLWAKLVHEEAQEVHKAFLEEGPEQQLKELADLRYVIVGLSLVRPQFLSLLVGEDDAMLPGWNAANEIIGGFLDGEDRFTLMQLEEAFARVHASNMSKLGDDGKPIRREDGKILKSSNYKAPDLSDLIVKEAA